MGQPEAAGWKGAGKACSRGKDIVQANARGGMTLGRRRIVDMRSGCKRAPGRVLGTASSAPLTSERRRFRTEAARRVTLAELRLLRCFGHSRRAHSSEGAILGHFLPHAAWSMTCTGGRRDLPSNRAAPDLGAERATIFWQMLRLVSITRGRARTETGEGAAFSHSSARSMTEGNNLVNCGDTYIW